MLSSIHAILNGLMCTGACLPAMYACSVICLAFPILGGCTVALSIFWGRGSPQQVTPGTRLGYSRTPISGSGHICSSVLHSPLYRSAASGHTNLCHHTRGSNSQTLAHLASVLCYLSHVPFLFHACVCSEDCINEA